MSFTGGQGCAQGEDPQRGHHCPGQAALQAEQAHPGCRSCPARGPRGALRLSGSSHLAAAAMVRAHRAPWSCLHAKLTAAAGMSCIGAYSGHRGRLCACQMVSHAFKAQTYSDLAALPMPVCYVQAHATGAASDRLHNLAVSDVLAPALVKLYTQVRCPQHLVTRSTSTLRQLLLKCQPAQSHAPQPPDGPSCTARASSSMSYQLCCRWTSRHSSSWISRSAAWLATSAAQG